MDSGTRLALQAILQGLRASGAISANTLTIVVDELRYASREAEELLMCPESDQIRRLARDLGRRRGFDGMRVGDGRFAAPAAPGGAGSDPD